MLSWPAVPAASRYALWVQWRVPEGEVVRSLELTAAESRVALPASPQRWRPLTLQVELRSNCAAGSSSDPAVLHQIQYDPAAACPPVQSVEPVRGPNRTNSGRATYLALRWQGSADERFEIAWFDAASGRRLRSAEVLGSQVTWPADVETPILIGATRSCAAGHSSTWAYLLVP